jgi:NNP family nitrate/nitrite transporter-like MFS transporter
VGSAAGLVGGLGAFGAFAIPPIMGLIAGAIGTWAGYARGFFVLVVLVAIDLGIVWLLGTYTKNRQVTLSPPKPAMS